MFHLLQKTFISTAHNKLEVWNIKRADDGRRENVIGLSEDLLLLTTEVCGVFSVESSNCHNVMRITILI